MYSPRGDPAGIGVAGATLSFRGVCGLEGKEGLPGEACRMRDHSLDVERILALLTGSEFVMTSQHENRRAGVLVRWVCACADSPLLVSVSLRKGHWIVPIIRDSRAFALCRIEATDRLAHKKFADTARPRDGDQFEVFGAQRLCTGAPVLPRSPA